MTERQRATISGGAIALTGVAVLAICLILGIAGLVLSTQCLAPVAGLGHCPVTTDPVETASVEPPAATMDNVTTLPMTTPRAVPAKVMDQVAPPPAAKVVDQAVLPPAANDFIEGTFELLTIEVEASPAKPGAATAKAATTPAENGNASPTDPLWAGVKPLVFSGVRSGVPQPEAPVPASPRTVARVAYGTEPQMPDATPAADSAAEAMTSEAGQSAQQTETLDAPPTAIAERPAHSTADSDKRIVGGSGVNVRSGPSKTNAKLFALAAGQEVTVTGENKGWLQVVDARGRSGWIYKTYLSSPG